MAEALVVVLLAVRLLLSPVATVDSALGEVLMVVPTRDRDRSGVTAL